MKRSELEKLFEVQITQDGIRKPVLEFEFTDVAKYRFDFAWPEAWLAVEIEGATWAGGRHTSGKGFADDCMKYNVATLEGWRVFRFTGDMVREGYARRMIRLAFEGLDA